jgi:hypothetical protein
MRCRLRYSRQGETTIVLRPGGCRNLVRSAVDPASEPAQIIDEHPPIDPIRPH